MARIEHDHPIGDGSCNDHGKSPSRPKRLSEIFQVSADLAQSYVHYLHEAFIANLSPYYSLKAAERTRNPQKIYANDLGLRKVVQLATSPDHGKLIETQVYNHLLRKRQADVFYWKGKGEIDFLVQEGIVVTQLIQVAYQGLDDPKVIAREVSSLYEGMAQYKNAKAYLIVWEIPEGFDAKQFENIEILPLWHFLLQEGQ